MIPIRRALISVSDKAGVVELALEVAPPQLVVAGELVVSGGNAFAQHHLQAPALQGLQSRRQLVGGNFTGGAHDGHALAALQGGRKLNRHKERHKRWRK